MFRLAYWLLLLTTALLLFISVWIVVPVPDARLLPLGVGSPEVSPVLLAASLLLAPVAAAKARRSGVARLALVLALVSAALSAVPIAQIPSTLASFDAAMKSTRQTEKPDMRADAVVLRELFRPAEPGDARVTRHIEFARPDGVALKLDVYRPRAQGRFPVLIQIYGGSWQNGSPSRDEPFARYFASHGYVVFAIDYRHAPAWRWPEQLEDARAGLVWVAEHAPSYGGDPTRIALVGRSAGAQLAMRMAYQEAPSSIKAVVNFYGPVDLTDGWRHPPQPDPLHVRGILETFLGGTPDQNPERYRHASPIAYAASRVPPTLHIYGARDHIVEARFGRMIDRELKKSGNTSVLLEFPWSEHAFDIVPNGLGGQISLYYTERFLSWALH
jgi:acetyl esterase/lipase